MRAGSFVHGAWHERDCFMCCLPTGLASDSNAVVHRQLDQLDAEAEALAAQLKEARAASLKDPGNELLKGVVNNLMKEEMARLDEIRKALGAMLSGVTHMGHGACRHLSIPACLLRHSRYLHIYA